MIKFKLAIDEIPPHKDSGVAEISGEFPDAVTTGALLSVIMSLEQVEPAPSSLTDDHLLRLAAMSRGELAIDAALRTILSIAADVESATPGLLALELRMAEAQLRWAVAYRSHEDKAKDAEIQTDIE